jgi:thiol-disulfide isomerase/thioredoxin
MRADRRLPFAVLTTFVLAAGPLLLGGSCGAAQENGDESSGSSPSNTRVDDLEAVDTAELTRTQKRVWADLINDQLSPCGDPVSVGRCVDEARSCRQCVPAARYLARLVADGYERSEIESHYRDRFGPDAEVEIDLEGRPVRGSPMAPVTIVEFSDFECPFCGRAAPILEAVLEEFEGQVRLVFFNYPLSMHAHALQAARAVVAAGRQGRFWEMHDLLFEHQQSLEDEDLMRYAEQLELDLDRFRSDLESEAVQRAVEADRSIGRQVELEGTPTIFVNNRRFNEPITALARYIREELGQ